MNPVTTDSNLLCKRPHTDQEKAQSKQDATASKIPKRESTTPEGKHIAKREAFQWLNYGDPKIWDLEFESAVTDAVDSIKKGTLKTPSIIGHFEKIRFAIASKKNNSKADLFGSRRNIETQKFSSKSYYTNINRQHKAYGYALERAVKIPYDGKHFIESQSDDGKGDGN